MTVLAEKLRETRERLRYKQSDVAIAVNVAPSTLSMYESGARDPATDVLVQLATFYNVSVDYLLGRSDESGTTGKQHYSTARDMTLTDPLLHAVAQLQGFDRDEVAVLVHEKLKRYKVD